MRAYCNLVIGILLCTFLCGCSNQHLYKETRVMMGTFIEVTSPSCEALKIAFDELKRVEDLLSKYNPESEVAKLNKFGNIKASPETFYLIKRAVDFCRMSGGAFDITVGPLMDLWGFTDKHYRLPQEEEIRKALKLVGSDKIILHDFNNVVEFKTRGVKIDLGGIAKGYALDCAVNKLKASGVPSCLLNAGGQVRALGYKFCQPWAIAVKNPQSAGIAEKIALFPDESCATSGDYEQYFIKEGRRYAHILDPRTGYPANSGIASVTVVASDGLTADALSTAIFVLGKEKGLALVEMSFPGARLKIIEEKDVYRNK